MNNLANSRNINISPSKIKQRYSISPHRYSDNEEIILPTISSKHKKNQTIDHTILMKNNHSKYSALAQSPSSQLYAKKISRNIQKYMVALRRHQHHNSLVDSESEQQLVRLHYRIKKQRELQMIRQQIRHQSLDFKRLIHHYQ